MKDVWLDLRYATRTLLRSRSFSVMTVLMLALAIGANTAIFSLVLTVLIRPLPYKDEERIVWLSNRNPALGINGAFLNPADILDFREQSKSFERIAAWGTLPVNLYGASTPERVEGVFVTPNFFRESLTLFARAATLQNIFPGLHRGEESFEPALKHRLSQNGRPLQCSNLTSLR